MAATSLRLASPDSFLRMGRQVATAEADAIAALAARIDDSFVAACQLLLACTGRVIVTGMGKSGHIGGKIAATLASTGSPAFFVHPGEACHGDLGMITAHDTIIALSHSGETDELLTMLPLLKRLHIPLIAITGNPLSSLATEADVHLDGSVKEEACPLGLAPTSSTTVALVLGDALAVALLEARGFTREDFALSHPGGSLGRKLLLRVRDVIHRGADVPHVEASASVGEAVLEMTAKKLGMTAVVDEPGRVCGIFTDGDLRRMFERTKDIAGTPIAQVMTRRCTTIGAELLAAEALRVMEDRRINALLIVDEDRRLIGALNMHDLLRAGVV